MSEEVLAKSSEMYACDGGDTIVCRDCGQTKPLFTAVTTGSMDEPTIWHCGDCWKSKNP